jgi:hypothetical protein
MLIYNNNLDSLNNPFYFGVFIMNFSDTNQNPRKDDKSTDQRKDREEHDQYLNRKKNIDGDNIGKRNDEENK